jgi:hypothetical protein
MTQLLHHVDAAARLGRIRKDFAIPAGTTAEIAQKSDLQVSWP